MLLKDRKYLQTYCVKYRNIFNKVVYDWIEAASKEAALKYYEEEIDDKKILLSCTLTYNIYEDL